MADFYKGSIPIYDPDVNVAALHPPDVGYGYVPRDYREHPEAMFAHPDEMQLVPASEDDARYDEQEETKHSLEHIYLSGPNGTPRFVNLDQNGHGYCWAYSVGTAIMLDRLRRNYPPIRVNPHGPAAILKKGRDEGGWWGLSAEFGRNFGYPVEGTGPGQWPLHSRDIKKYDTPLLRSEMAKHRITEDWVDLTRKVYDQTMTTRQFATCGFNNQAAPSDFPWWAHSVCQVRWVRIERGSWGPLILNSWKGWGYYGLAVLRGDKAIAGGGGAIRSTTPSVN